MIEILRKLVGVGVGLRESELSLASDPSEGLEVVQFRLGLFGATMASWFLMVFATPTISADVLIATL